MISSRPSPGSEQLSLIPHLDTPVWSKTLLREKNWDNALEKIFAVTGFT